jgi:hypothetical protein
LALSLFPLKRQNGYSNLASYKLTIYKTKFGKNTVVMDTKIVYKCTDLEKRPFKTPYHDFAF